MSLDDDMRYSSLLCSFCHYQECTNLTLARHIIDLHRLEQLAVVMTLPIGQRALMIVTAKVE